MKLRPIRLHGTQRHAKYKVTGRERLPSCHRAGQGAEDKEVPGRGPPQENSRLVSPVRARGGATNGRGAWVGGCPWVAARHAARAQGERERESDITRWASCFEGSWAIRGRRQEEVSIGSASTSYLPTYPFQRYHIWLAEGGRVRAGRTKVWGSLFAGGQGQWLGSPFEEAQAGSSETC